MTPAEISAEIITMHFKTISILQAYDENLSNS